MGGLFIAFLCDNFRFFQGGPGVRFFQKIVFIAFLCDKFSWSGGYPLLFPPPPSSCMELCVHEWDYAYKMNFNIELCWQKGSLFIEGKYPAYLFLTVLVIKIRRVSQHKVFFFSVKYICYRAFVLEMWFYP